MQYSEIISAINSFGTKKVLIIGDVMVDAYLRGKVERISPEAPIPVVSVSQRENRLGGAANVALNIQALGATPILCSVIGMDEFSSVFNRLMDKAGLSKQGIIEAVNRKTTAKTRVISSNQHLLRVDDEQSDSISDALQTQFIANISAICQKQTIDAIIFEDYDKGVITPKIIHEVTTLAKNLNIIVAVDPKKRNFSAYTNISLFKPNFKEFCEGLNCSIAKDDISNMSNRARKYMTANNIDNFILTLSEHGILALDKKNYFHFETEHRDIADVSGAGDTVISIATLCLCAKLDIKQTAYVSNIAGGLVCERSGVVPIDLELLKQELTQ